MARVDRQPTFKNTPALGALFVLALALLSAAPPVYPEEFIRRGNEALERGLANQAKNEPADAQFEEALRVYQEVAERAADPGLVAFNQATAYYHLKDFRKAESHYRMALDDAAIPAERRSKALYNLGNCLVRVAGEKDVQILRDAIGCFELCLDSKPNDELRGHAAFNLELAKVLWNKARATMAEQPPLNDNNPPKEDRPPEPKKKEEKKQNDDTPAKDLGKEAKKAMVLKIDQDKKGKIEGKSDEAKLELAPKPSPSRAPVLPDTDKVVSLPPEITRLILQKAEERLRVERLRNRADLAVPETPSGRDW